MEIPVAVQFATGENNLRFDPISSIRSVRALQVVGMHIRNPTLTAAVPPIVRAEVQIGMGRPVASVCSNVALPTSAILLPIEGAADSNTWYRMSYATPIDVLDKSDGTMHHIDRMSFRLSQFDGSAITHTGVVLLLRAVIGRQTDADWQPTHSGAPAGVRY